MSIKSVMSSNCLILCHLLFSCPQSFPASGFFPMSCLFTSGAQSIGASASSSVLPMSIQGWFPLGLIHLISLQSKETPTPWFKSINSYLPLCLSLISFCDETPRIWAALGSETRCVISVERKTVGFGWLWVLVSWVQVPVQVSCETCMQVKKQLLELDMEQWTGWKLGKEYIKAVYCHPAYLTYMQSTSHKMSSWMKHKLESRLPGEISITSDMQMIPPLRQKVKKSKEPLDKSERGEWKSWLKAQHSEN